MTGGGGYETGRLLIDALALERRVALIDGDRVSRLWIDRGGPARFDIHLGRITKILPEMAAAMVALDGVDDGLLPFDRYRAPLHEGPIHEGQWVLVQISRLGFDDKGPKLTGHIALEGLGMILRPDGRQIELPRKLKDADGRRAELAGVLKSLQRDQDGITLRSQAIDWDDVAIAGEYKLLKQAWAQAQLALRDPQKPQLVFKAQSEADQVIERHLLAGGECVVDGADEYVRLRGVATARGQGGDRLTRHTGNGLLFEREGVEDAIDTALSTNVALPGGGWIAVEQTTALCAIDVNAGGADAGRAAEVRALEVNLRAANEIVHQIRLRNLGGLIVIDPLRMKSRAGRDQFENALRDAFGPDINGAVQIGGFTRLGLFELTRQRGGASLADLMQAPRPLRGLSHISALNRVVRGVIRDLRTGLGGQLRLSVAPDLLDDLAPDTGATQILVREIGARPEIIADPVLGPGEYRLEKT